VIRLTGLVTSILSCLRAPKIAIARHRSGHGGRDGEDDWSSAFDADGKPIALFRCTQMVLWPKG